MRKLLDRLHGKLGDLWWYSLMIFIACRSGDVIQAFIGLWLVPKYVGQEELGAVLPLQQLSGLFAVPLAILATVFAKYVNTYATRGEYGKVKSFIHDVLRAACAVFLLCIGAAYLIIPHFYERLNVASGMLTVLILAAGFATNVASLFTSALQGLKKFRTMTVQNLIGAPIRLVTLLVAMPFRALSGYILGQATPPATCSLLAAYSLHKDLKSTPLDTSWRKDLPEIWRYLWPVAVYTAFSVLFNALQATVFRQRLAELESAAYYVITRFTETAGYIGITFSLVLFPLASEAHEKGRQGISLTMKSLCVTMAFTVGIAVVFHCLGGWILSLTEEWSRYLPYARLLPWWALYAGLASVVGFLLTSEIACRRFVVPALYVVVNGLWTATLISLAGSSFFNGILSPETVAWMQRIHIARLDVLTYASVGIMATLVLASLFLHIRLTREHNRRTAR